VELVERVLNPYLVVRRRGRAPVVVMFDRRLARESGSTTVEIRRSWYFGSAKSAAIGSMYSAL